MGLTKAKLEIEKEVGMSIVEVLFNPSEYQLTDGASPRKRYLALTRQFSSIFPETQQNCR